MKNITYLLAALLLLAGCNNPPAAPEEKPAQTKEAQVRGASKRMVPYTGRLMEVTVKDFNKWFAAVIANDSFRRTYALTDPGIGRGIDDGNKGLVLVTVGNMEKSKLFDNRPNRQESLKRAGVTDVSPITYWNVLMDDTNKVPQMERVMIKHRVKDFDAWKKAFDAEGKETRATHGMVDRLIARNANDTNEITLLFAITDMEKVKARVNSPEIKKIMTEAGVVDTPKVSYFKWVAI